MLSISNLCVSLDNEQPIIKNFSLNIQPGFVHAIMGPNGSGKSTLAYTLMGHPRYTIKQGSITYKDQDISILSPDKRAKLGIFLAFQHPYEIPGVSVLTFLKEAHHAITGTLINLKDFQATLQAKMQLLSIDPNFMHRNLNEGFSGGEKKRLEMLQLLILKPSLVILDEIDSGLDIDALKAISQALNQARTENPMMSVIIITHYQRLLHYIIPDYVHIMQKGTLIKSGDAQLADQLEQKGYDAFDQK
jgi:Fe-S cluster assembly ATP-binding protein